MATKKGGYKAGGARGGSKASTASGGGKKGGGGAKKGAAKSSGGTKKGGSKKGGGKGKSLIPAEAKKAVGDILSAAAAGALKGAAEELVPKIEKAVGTKASKKASKKR